MSYHLFNAIARFALTYLFNVICLHHTCLKLLTLQFESKFDLRLPSQLPIYDPSTCKKLFLCFLSAKTVLDCLFHKRLIISNTFLLAVRCRFIALKVNSLVDKQAEFLKG